MSDDPDLFYGISLRAMAKQWLAGETPDYGHRIVVPVVDGSSVCIDLTPVLQAIAPQSPKLQAAK